MVTLKKRQRIFKAALELIIEHGVRCAPEQDVETELKATAPHLDTTRFLRRP